jgi:AraC-like DNA-binding protein
MMYRTPHFHKSMELMVVLTGEMDVNTEHSTFRLSPHDMVLINSGSPHELAACSTGCTFLCLQFLPDSYLPNFPPVLFSGSRPRDYLTQEQYQQLEQQLLDMALKYFRHDDFYEVYCISTTNYILYALLTNLPHHMLSAKNNRQELMSARLMRLVDYVDENYARRPSLAEFAASESRSLSYISRFVKNALNQSFQSYVNTVRFYAACRLIADGTMSMLDICYEVGFSDYRYFSNVFKERTGLTPAQYQKMEANTVRIFPNYDQEHIFSDEDSVTLLNSLMVQGSQGGTVLTKNEIERL